MKNCTKAIISVAGYGTRRLPIVKSVDKCMLPLLNRPVVDYIVQDCVKAGITDIYFVVSDSADQLRNYYERNVELEEYLRSKGKTDLIEQITPPAGVSFHYVQQDLKDARYGTSVPVWLCRDYVEDDELVAIVMGDQTLYHLDGKSEVAQLLADMSEHNISAGLVGVKVHPKDVSSYGIIDHADHIYKQIVEKPEPADAPSNLNNASMYVLPGNFMKYVNDNMEQPQEDEYLFIDPINAYVADGNQVYVHESDAKYLDCGTVGAWVQANQWLLEHQL